MPIFLGNSPEPRSHLVLPDDHRHPADNWRRFDALGNYIVETLPEVIVFLGDSADMASLCSYDQGKRDMVFKNVKDDIESYHEGEKHIFAPMLSLNERRRKLKERQYSPVIIKIRGNHEHRVQRLLDYEPKWDGSVSMDSFNTRTGLEEIIIPFQECVEIDGVYYSHFFPSGVKGTAFNSAKLMIQKRGVSCTMGHVHTYDIASTSKPNGELIRGLIAGSFHDPDHRGFAGPMIDKVYWNGIFMKHDVKNGDYALEEIPVKRLLDNYL